jgi:uncharacterized membrane protein YidH (DUF202 family)
MINRHSVVLKSRVVMEEEKMSDTELKISDILALDRTRMAAERTLMAWVRTALSMIGFGVQAPLLAFSALMVPPNTLLAAYMAIRSRKVARASQK